MRVNIWACTVLLLGVLPILAQQSPSTPGKVAVPPLINFSGVLTDLNGKPLKGVVGVTFCLYKDQEGGAPLWIEIQNVEPDRSGHYTVTLGSSSSYGLPADIFVASEAHWLGVEPEGQAEQPRILLLSVPYALKAGDAETIGGLPPSAFMLANGPGGASAANDAAAPASAIVQENSAPPANPTVTGKGVIDFIPMWDTTSDIVDSVLFQKSSQIGINTTTPASTLDVKGGGTIRGTLSLPATGTATASKGFNSQPLSQSASAFNSSTSKAVSETFHWQAEPAGNNTSTPSGTLNLLFGSGTSKPSETGLHIASNGQINFAAGQTFPGTGNGTITGVTAGSGLMGGGSSGNVTLSLASVRPPRARRSTCCRAAT